MYGTKHFCCNCFITYALILAQIMFCIAQQSNTILEKTTADFVTSKTWAKNTNTTELVSNLNKYESPAYVQQSGEQIPVTLLKKATPIACYECNSHKDPDCITQPEKFKKNCTDVSKGSDFVGCRKIDQWVDYDSGEEMKAHHRVIRQCASDGDISKPCYYRAGFGGRINACFCDTDLCNSVHSLKIINSNILLFLISFLFLYHYNGL